MGQVLGPTMQQAGEEPARAAIVSFAYVYVCEVKENGFKAELHGIKGIRKKLIWKILHCELEFI